MIVRGELGNLPVPRLKVKCVCPTRCRNTIIIHTHIAHARGLLVLKTELFATTGRSVGIDCSGDLNKHLTVPPMETEHVWPTREPSTIIANLSMVHTRGLLASKTGLFAPTDRSVGVDFSGKPRQTPPKASSHSELGIDNKEMRCNNLPTHPQQVGGRLA